MNHHLPILRAAAAALCFLCAASASSRAQTPALAEPLRISDRSMEGAPGRVLSGAIPGPRTGEIAWRSPSGNVLQTGTACATNDWKSLAAGARHVLAVKQDGSLWAWGDNSAGQLGVGGEGYAPSAASPVLVSPVNAQNSNRWEHVFAAGGVSGGIQSDGSLWLWGTGPQNLGSQPQKIISDFIWEFASTDGQSVALVSRSGELYILELSTLAAEQPAFRLVGGSALWKSCAIRGSHILAIKRDGTLWRLPLQDGEAFYEIGGQFRWKSVDIGDGYFVALRENGTLWGASLVWGEPLPGGEGVGWNPYSPVQLGDSNAWVQVAAGTTPLAVDRAGKVFWVSGYSTRMADGPKGLSSRVFVPKKASDAMEYTYSLSGFSLGRDNTLWSWGSNTHGQLGNFEVLGEDMGFTESRAQVGVSPHWNLPSPVLGIATGYSLSEGSEAGVYSLSVGDSVVGQIAVQNWTKPETAKSFVHFETSGSVTLQESIPAAVPGTAYRWLRNGTLFPGGSQGSLSVNTSGVYWAESFTERGSLQVSGGTSANRITVANTSNLQVGMTLEGTGIPPGTVITGFIGSGSVTLSGTLRAPLSNASVKFGLTSRGEPRVVNIAPQALQNVYDWLGAASTGLNWDYSQISSDVLASLLNAGSLKATASLLKAAVDLLSVVSDSSFQVQLRTTAGGTAATFVSGVGPSPRNASLTAGSLKVGDEITPTEIDEFGTLNFPRGTRITAINDTTIRLSQAALITSESSGTPARVSTSPARRVLRSWGINGGLDPRPGSASADLENLVLPGSLDTAPLKKWLLNTNAALADRNPLGQLQNADTLLGEIKDPTFCAVIPLKVLAGNKAGAETFVVDYGDVLLLRSWVRLGMAALRWLDLQNTDMDLVALQRMMSEGTLSLQSIWERYTALGGPGSGAQTNFEADLKAALQHYQAFSQFTNPRFGQQGASRLIPSHLCLFPVEPDEERQMRDIVDKALDSLNATSATAGIRTFQLGDQEFLTASPNAFIKRVANRADFPAFVGNRYVPGSLKTDLALAVYPDLSMMQIAGVERWLMALEPRLDRQWKTGPAATLAIANTSVQGNGWISVSGTLTGSAPVGGVKVNAESVAGGTFSSTAVFTERTRLSASDPRIYDWSIQLPAPIVGGSVKITASAANATNARSSRTVERQVPVTASALPPIPTPGSLAVAVVAGDSPETGRPADFAVLFAGSGALSYQWMKGGTPIEGDQGLAGAVDDWAMVSVGNTHSVAIKRDGTLWTWGSNGSGQLGFTPLYESSNFQRAPAQVGSDADWVSVACSDTKTFALKRDGTLWETTTDADDFRAAKVGKMARLLFSLPEGESDSSANKTACGSFSVNPSSGALVAVTRDGALWQSWGGSFTRIESETPWIAAAAGAANFAIKRDGSLWGWVNDAYALGVWSSPGIPVPFSYESDWVDVRVAGSSSNDATAARYAVALKKDGSLWAWGRLPWNRFYSPDFEEVVPQRLGPPSMTWSEVFPGATSLLAVTTRGEVFEFEWDPMRPRPVPLAAPALAGSRSNATSAILTQDGMLWMWGDNTQGQLGNYRSSGNDNPDPFTFWNSTNTPYLSDPIQVGVNPDWKLPGPVRGIPVPFHRDSILREDLGSYQVQVSRGSDRFQWRVFAGDGLGGSADGAPWSASFSDPRGMTLAGGSLYVVETTGAIRQIRLSTGSVTTMVFPNDALLSEPVSVASSGGTLFVLERTSGAIRKVVPKSGGRSDLSTVIDGDSLVSSDYSIPAKAPFSIPSGIAIDASGTLYVADSGNHVIRRISPRSSSAPVLAGILGEFGFQDGTGTGAQFNNPTGLALIGGTLFVADQGNNAIRRIQLSSGAVSTFAGIQPNPDLLENSPESRDGVGQDARFYSPTQLAMEAGGTLYVSEPEAFTLRRITPDGRVTTIGGIPRSAGSQEQDPYGVPSFSGPFGVVVSGGTVFVSDSTWIRAGSPPATGALRGSAQVTLVHLDLGEIATTPRILSTGASWTLSAGANTPQDGVTYQWNRNGTPLANALGMTPTLTASTSGWYSLTARAGSASISTAPIPVCVDNANVTRARAAMAQGNFALASGTLSATSKDGTELILRSLMDLYGFLNEAPTRTALGTLGVTISGTLANGWVDPWSMQLNGSLKNLSGPAPTAPLKAIFTGSLGTSLHSKLESADAKLATITDRNFVTILRPSDLGNALPDADPIVIDFGDVQFGRAMLHAAMAALKWLEMQNTDVDLFTLLFSSQNGRLSLESLLTRYPSLLAASATGAAAQTAFEARIKDALRFYQGFSDFVNPVSGLPSRMVQNLGAVTLESPQDRADERLTRDAVNKALDSINAASVAAGVRSYDLGGGSMSPPLSARAFVKHAPGWRSDLPRFQKNRYIPNSLNLAAMRSLYPNLSYGEVAQIESSKFLSESFWNQLLGTREDDAAPVLNLSADFAAGLKTSDGFVEIRGTASDASGVDSVRITLGATGESYDALLEELAPSDAGLRQYAWSLILPLPATLTGGSLQFRIAAQDALGGRMESPLERSALVLRMVPVSRSFLGNGSITLNPSPDADGLVVAGTSMLVTATPAAGNLLRRIELTVDGEAQPNQTVKTTSGGTLRFTVTAPTDLLAVFEVNPYPLLGGRNKMVGGLLQPDAYFGSEPLMAVQCTITSSGEFSGKLFVGRQASSFKGSFDEDGRGVFTTPTAQAWLPYSKLTQERKMIPTTAALSLWVDTSDETAPVLYARVGEQSTRLTALAAMDYTGTPALTGVFGQVEDKEDWMKIREGLGDGSPRSGGFVSILPRRSGGFSLAGVLPSGEKISASGFLSGQFRGEAAFADQPAQLGDFSKIELLTPTGLQGATAFSGTLSVPADASKTRAFLGSVRRENWLSLTRGPKYATGPTVSPKAYAAEWTVGAVGFTPASSGRVLAPFAKNGAPTTSNVLAVGLKSPASEELSGEPAFSLAADTRNRLFVSGRPAAGVSNPAIFLNTLTGVFNGSFRQAGLSVSLQGVLIQGDLPVGTNLPYTAEGAGYTSDRRTVVLGGGEFVVVSGGSLPENSQIEPSERTVNTFAIGKTEVTWAQWLSVLGWAWDKGYDSYNWAGQGVGDFYPVTHVNWYDVLKWCNARSEREGKTPVYMVGDTVYRSGQSTPYANASADGYRLPSEAEWEFAARGGTQTKGYIYSGSNNLNEVGWFLDNSGSHSHEVGKKQPNELGLYDMSGNVWEWTLSRDWRGFSMLRAGAFSDIPYYCEVGSRASFNNPTDRSAYYGFRLARSIAP